MRLRGLVGVFGCAMVCAGSALADAAARGIKSVRTLKEIRNEDVVRQHWDLSCGAASIATLLTYQLGDPVSEREVALEMLRDTHPLLVQMRLGFSLLDLKRLAARHGYAATGFGGLSFEEVADLAPVIVPIRAYGYDHFVVLRGVVNDKVVLADPAFGNRVMPRRDFLSIWANGIGFVVNSPGDPDPPNRMGVPAALDPGAAPERIRAVLASNRNRPGVR